MKNVSHVNRRSFLKRTVSAAGVAAVAAPMILPRNAMGANDRVVLGIIGVGNQGRANMNRLKSRCSIAAIADVYLPRAEQVAKSVNAKHVYQDYRKLLERDDIDAVVIATPLHWHALNCIHAAQAGKDIYCEKPLTHSIVEGRRIVEAVRKYNRVLQTGSQQRSGRNEHIGITHVRNGTLGKIERVIAYNYRSGQQTRQTVEEIPEGLDWDMWCGPAIKPPYNFVIWDNRSKPSWSGIERFSGGDMTDWGAHGLDIAQWGLDMDESGPEEIWTEGEPFKPMYSTPEDPGQRRDGPRTPTVYMKYPGGMILDLSGGGHWNNKSGVSFVGEKGSINVTRGGCGSDPGELIDGPLENPQNEVYRGYEYAQKTGHREDWLNCIKERRQPVANAEAGHRTATVCHLANIARWVSEVTGETGQKLKWDAEKERFSNCEIANSFYLDPPRRKGYELPETV